jgi:cell wall-associated NlpC family hydrolase
MFAYDRVLLKTVGSILLSVTIVGSLPQPADADPPRATQAKLAEVKGPKKNKKKRTWTAHGFTSWTRRTPGTAFAPLPTGARRTSAEIAVATARDQIGKPYRWGGSGPSSFDCSGLTSFAWAAAGVHLPHSSRGQYASLRRVPLDELQPGDVVYRPGHIGLYIGKGRMIHAPQSGRNVEIAPIDRAVGGGRPE